jgi:lipopolysaccharide biosynthesis protein
MSNNLWEKCMNTFRRSLSIKSMSNILRTKCFMIFYRSSNDFVSYILQLKLLSINHWKICMNYGPKFQEYLSWAYLEQNS